MRKLPFCSLTTMMGVPGVVCSAMIGASLKSLDVGKIGMRRLSTRTEPSAPKLRLCAIVQGASIRKRLSCTKPTKKARSKEPLPPSPGVKMYVIRRASA